MSTEKKKESEATVKINQTERGINKNTSQSTIRSKLSQIDRYTKDVANSLDKQADITKKIASKSSDLNRYQLQLVSEEARERKKQEDSHKRLVREQLDYQRNLTHELKTQREIIQDSASLKFFGFNPDPVKEEIVTYDVFISHASEDKDDFVRPLAEELVKIGVKVWYDEFSLKWGDSLRSSIDKGLANSKFGVIVISTSFITKKWPEYEVNGLVAKEINGENKILPIWHKVTKTDVMKYSPSLADKLAMNSSIHEIPYIAQELKGMLCSGPET
jgi:hypothetical protein